MDDATYQALIEFATKDMTPLEKALYLPPFQQYGSFASSISVAVNNGHIELAAKLAEELFGEYRGDSEDDNG